jgi:hypothetical protein
MEPSEEAAPRIARVDCGIEAPLRGSGACYLPDDAAEGDQGIDHGPAAGFGYFPGPIFSSLARSGEIRAQDVAQFLDRLCERAAGSNLLHAIWILCGLEEHRRNLGPGDTHIVGGLHDNLARAVQHLADRLLRLPVLRKRASTAKRKRNQKY